MKLLSVSISLIFIVILSSCSPKVITKLSTSYPVECAPHEVVVFNQEDSIPYQVTELGVVVVKDAGLSVNCGYDKVLYLAKQATSESGGNGLYIVEHVKPHFWGSTCHQLSGLMLKTDYSLESPPTYFVSESMPPRFIPSNVVTLNSGYAFLTSAMYDNMGNKYGALAGVNFNLQYEHVFKKGLSLGLRASYFETDMTNGDLSLWSVAPTVGLYTAIGKRWILRGDVSVGFISCDDTWSIERGTLVGVNLGTEYLVTRFLGVGFSASSETGFFPKRDGYYYGDSTFSGISRIALSVGLRFYF